MSTLGSKLRKLEDGAVMFRCPGCGDNHMIYVEAPTDGLQHAVWSFNGNGDRPTFTPSILVRSGHHAPHHKPGDSCWCTYNVEHPDSPAPFECRVCHSYITDGQIQYLSDCTHELAGKTVPLPDFNEA